MNSGEISRQCSELLVRPSYITLNYSLDPNEIVEQRKSDFTSLSSISVMESLKPRYKLILINTLLGLIFSSFVDSEEVVDVWFFCSF